MSVDYQNVEDDPLGLGGEPEQPSKSMPMFRVFPMGNMAPSDTTLPPEFLRKISPPSQSGGQSGPPDVPLRDDELPHEVPTSLPPKRGKESLNEKIKSEVESGLQPKDVPKSIKYWKKLLKEKNRVFVEQEKKRIKDNKKREKMYKKNKNGKKRREAKPLPKKKRKEKKKINPDEEVVSVPIDALVDEGEQKQPQTGNRNVETEKKRVLPVLPTRGGGDRRRDQSNGHQKRRDLPNLPVRTKNQPRVLPQRRDGPNGKYTSGEDDPLGLGGREVGGGEGETSTSVNSNKTDVVEIDEDDGKQFQELINHESDDDDVDDIDEDMDFDDEEDEITMKKKYLQQYLNQNEADEDDDFIDQFANEGGLGGQVKKVTPPPVTSNVKKNARKIPLLPGKNEDIVVRKFNPLAGGEGSTQRSGPEKIQVKLPQRGGRTKRQEEVERTHQDGKRGNRNLPPTPDRRETAGEQDPTEGVEEPPKEQPKPYYHQVGINVFAFSGQKPNLRKVSQSDRQVQRGKRREQVKKERTENIQRVPKRTQVPPPVSPRGQRKTHKSPPTSPRAPKRDGGEGVPTVGERTQPVQQKKTPEPKTDYYQARYDSRNTFFTKKRAPPKFPGGGSQNTPKVDFSKFAPKVRKPPQNVRKATRPPNRRGNTFNVKPVKRSSPPKIVKRVPVKKTNPVRTQVKRNEVSQSTKTVTKRTVEVPKREPMRRTVPKITETKIVKNKPKKAVPVKVKRNPPRNQVKRTVPPQNQVKQSNVKSPVYERKNFGDLLRNFDKKKEEKPEVKPEKNVNIGKSTQPVIKTEPKRIVKVEPKRVVKVEPKRVVFLKQSGNV